MRFKGGGGSSGKGYRRGGSTRVGRPVGFKSGRMRGGARVGQPVPIPAGPSLMAVPSSKPVPISLDTPTVQPERAFYPAAVFPTSAPSEITAANFPPAYYRFDAFSDDYDYWKPRHERDEGDVFVLSAADAQAAGTTTAGKPGLLEQITGGLRTAYEIYREEKLRREMEKRRKLGLPPLTEQEIARTGAGVTMRADPEQMNKILMYGGLGLAAVLAVMMLKKGRK